MTKQGRFLQIHLHGCKMAHVTSQAPIHQVLVKSIRKHNAAVKENEKAIYADVVRDLEDMLLH